MGQVMKVLIVGLGSIGRRHLSWLKQADNVECAALRTSKGTLTEPTGIQEFFSVEDALAFKPNGVLIANPTSLHVASALPFLEKGIRVLIEKPIAGTVSEAARLAEYKELIRVAYPMRFTTLSEFFKERFTEEYPFKVSFKRSFYLPKWHPYADYRNEYTAKKELGGGVIRTLSHEIDLAIHWFGEPVQVDGFTDKISFLEIDTDDFAFFSLKTKQGARLNFELDLFSPVNINIAEAFTSKGKYQWDMNSISFTAYGHDKPAILDVDLHDSMNQMYKRQVDDFLEFIQTGNSRCARYEEALSVMTIIEKIDGK